MKKNKFRHSHKFEKTRSVKLNATINNCNKKIDKNPENVQSYFIRAHLKSTQGDLKGAVEDLDFVLLNSPNNMKALINRAIILNFLGEYQGAITDLTNAIEINPRVLDCYLLRGNAFRGAGKLEESNADFDCVIRFCPEEPLAYVGRGDTKILLHDLSGAKDDYKRAVEIDPTLKEVCFKVQL